MPLLNLKEWAVSIYRVWKPSRDPRFPVELERIIFELAAREDRHRIPTLMCVAARVKEWLEPILYEIIIYEHYLSRYPGRSRIITNGKFVQHLLLDNMSPGLAWDYLHSCPNLQTLSFAPDRFGLSFENFSDDSESEFDEYQPLPFRIGLPNNCPKYQHLTHLELMTHSPLNKINWFSSLPSLTHLLILSPMSNLNKAVNPIFARCPRIRVMLWCPWDYAADFRDAEDMTWGDIEGIQLDELEPRLVVARFIGNDYTTHFIEHSEGWWTSRNAWKMGEEIVDKRLEAGTTDYKDFVYLIA